MTCTGCARDRIALVVTSIVLQRVHPRTGRLKDETRTTRLCCSCCGDESEIEPSPQPDLTPSQAAGARQH